MTLYFEQHDSLTVRSRQSVAAANAAAIMRGDDGTEAQFVNAVTSLSKWQFSAQEFQPPALRVYQRYAGLMRADIVDRQDEGPFLIPLPTGWDVLPVQPPAPTRRPSAVAAWIAQGDAGNQFIFIPPWQFASPASSLPDAQNIAAAAIPSWNAGPQIGALKSIPNISSPTVLKAGPGTLFALTVVVPGSTVGGVYDIPANSPSVATQIATIPTTAGAPIVFDWPCQQGILIVPGAGQTVAAKWI